MRLGRMVLREAFERKSQLATSFLAVVLGIAVIVSIKNVTYYSEKAVASELDALGANILVLPKAATVQDYYSVDMQGHEMPEEYVARLVLSDLEGLDNLSPKLSVNVESGGEKLILTGILPKSEFQAKAMWRGAGIFARPATGCGSAGEVPGLFQPPPPEMLVRRRVIETLASDEVLAGAEAAARFGLEAGSRVELEGQPFSVSAVLPRTGTVDDSRLFAHLHRVQKLAAKGGVINAIEVVGCCQEISRGLVEKINKLLPEAKVVTVAQVVDTQVRTNETMSRLSLVFLVIMVLVGGASIANYMYANVFERRREIGTLVALGAEGSFILRLFLFKALALGLAGGACGYLLGTALAVLLGPQIARIPVLPMPELVVWALGISVAISLAASWLPARSAVRLDPSAALREV